MNDKAHILKNIYTVRLLDISGMKNSFHDAEGKLRWINVLQDDISWSAEFVVPYFGMTDRFDIDVIFDDDFRHQTVVNVGDRFSVSFSDNQIGIREVEILGIRNDLPFNHLQAK